MKLTYRWPGAAYSVQSTLEFAREGQSEFWSGPLFHFYPQLDRDRFFALDAAGRAAYLTEFFTGLERENRALLAEKAAGYQRRWQQHQPRITAAFEEAFGLDLTGRFDDLTANISFGVVEPRYLDRNTFDVFWMNSDRGALGESLHEIIHFLWFDVWQRHFRDDPAEYEAPSLKWILSEMAVEPVMRDERLRSINPYFGQENGGCVYPYFYTMRIDGQPVLDTLYGLYRRMPVTDFMEQSYAFCQAHEAEIRRHIAASEAGL